MLLKHTERTAEVAIPIEDGSLCGTLVIPEHAAGIVLFAHGSGSSRRSPRNEYVASVLREALLATLLFDLLTESEAEDRANVFDLELLARRLRLATDWVKDQNQTRGLPIGYFGASTGAGAALMAAAEDPRIGAVVSRGGRVDLAHQCLGRVRAPVLLIVGSHDPEVLRLNREVLPSIRGRHELAVVPGASHLFEEPGTLEQVAHLAQRWFGKYLTASVEGEPNVP